MMLTYKVPRNGFKGDRFLEEYVLPLGPSVGSASLDSEEGAKLELSAAKCLSFARASLLVASGVTDDWEVTTAREGPHDRFVGDLKPGSVEFSLAREGAADHHEIHMLEVPDEWRPMELNWRKGAKMRIVDEDEYFTILGNAAALLSFADHLAYLASSKTPPGTQLHYVPGRDLDPASLPMVIEKVDPSGPAHNSDERPPAPPA
jgi:hypothetical protein